MTSVKARPGSVRKMWTLWAHSACDGPNAGNNVLIGAYDTKAQLEAWLEHSISLFDAGESVLTVDPRTLAIEGPASSHQFAWDD